LIIKLGACPAPLNRNGNGVIPMVLTGDIGFDVNDIDLDSLLLSRADGVGGSVAPLNGPPGPKIKINDLNHPYVGPGPCSCNADQSADGIDDVQMKFSTGATVAALELDSLSPGDIVGFVLSGQTLGGDDFIATDCMQIVPQASPVNLLVQSNVENAWIRLAPEDVVIDGEGFAGFERTFLPGTTLNLTAPLAWNGKVFAHWNVNGVSQGPGRVLDLTIWDTTTVDAIFRDWGAPEPDFDAEAGVTGELQVIRP
jgi:hypothetical protein